MTHQANRPVPVGLRVYRALAAAFPYEFRNSYGDELLQVTEDAIDEIWRRYGVLGLGHLLLDIAVRVPVEHMAELRMLAGSPGFTAVALVSLSLGICIATCAYSELHGMLRDLGGSGQARPVGGAADASVVPRVPALPRACFLPRSLMSRRCRSALRAAGAGSGPGDNWSRLRTSPRWACIRCWVVFSTRRTNNQAGRRQP
jgi:hypothetical protein